MGGEEQFLEETTEVDVEEDMVFGVDYCLIFGKFQNSLIRLVK